MPEKRYIDADKISEYLHFEENGTPDERWKPMSEIEAIIKAMPTEDVVPVVRCKDCARCFTKITKRNKQIMRFCMGIDGNEFCVHENDFCSYGEREDEK